MGKPSFNKSRCYGGIIKSKSTGKYLLVKGHTGKWSFPKGHREKNETPYNCAQREIYEETGIEIENIHDKSIIFVSLYYYFDIEMDEECKVQPIDIKEVKDIKWYSPEETITIEKNKDVFIYFSRLLNIYPKKLKIITNNNINDTNKINI